MEDTMSLILHGCMLARNLELNLPNLSNQPNTLSNCCGEITRVFNSARDRLNTNLPQVEERHNELDIAVQAWLRASYKPSSSSGVKIHEMETERVLEGEEVTKSKTQFPVGEGSGTRSPVAQRTRKRKDGQEQRTVRVPAPRIGNTEIPPDDNFTWRKYGQKEILGSVFPRSYYRCTHKSFYGCDAKKQVQRLDEDPYTFEITYYGHHTCHISQIDPLQATLLSTININHQETKISLAPTSTSIPLYRWLSVDVENTSKDTTRLTELNLQTCTTVDDIDVAGDSNVRDANESVGCPLVDFADVIFNSGGSSCSMESIFPSSMQDN